MTQSEAQALHDRISKTQSGYPRECLQYDKIEIQKKELVDKYKLKES
jgi:hypothetical protein